MHQMNNMERGYNGNNLLKKKGVVIEWDENLIVEYFKCAKDPIYFVEKYIKILQPPRLLFFTSFYLTITKL
jgi:hypothetical protein